MQKGDLERAREFYERIRSGAEELDERWVYAFERWAHAIISLKTQNWNEAKDAFRKSSELWNELKHPYHYAQTLWELSTVLVNSGGNDEAKKLIDEVTRIFAGLGAKLDLEKLQSQLGIR